LKKSNLKAGFLAAFVFGFGADLGWASSFFKVFFLRVLLLPVLAFNQIIF